MIDHFPVAKGGKSDPQLIWNFGPAEVQLKSWETSLDSKGQLFQKNSMLLELTSACPYSGKAQLSTELTISKEEFDVYDLYSPPITIAFHLREFNVSLVSSTYIDA